jgi:hypothetical protein
MTRPPEPSDVIWTWRTVAAGTDSRAQDLRSAHRRGWVGGAVGLTAAGLLWLVFGRPVAASVVAGIGLALTAIALLWPLTLHRTITRALERFARIVASGVTWVLMTLLFYLVFLPLGLFLRTAGKLGITRGGDPKRASYWEPAAGREPTLDSYRRQF